MSTRNCSASLLLATVAASVAATALAIPENASNTGYWVGGAVNVSPFIEGGYIHDDNPNNVRKNKEALLADHGVTSRKDAEGYQIRPGFNVEIPGNCWKIAGRAYYSMIRYSADDVDDRDDWGESFAFSGETDGGLTWRLDESVVKVDLEEQYDDLFPYNYSTRDRLEMTFGGSLAKRITDKCRLEVGGSYSKTDYDYDLLYDYERYGGRLSFAHVLTEKTDWTATASHRINKQTPNSEGLENYDDDTSSTKFLLGIKSRSTERLTFDIQGGVEFYDGHETEDGVSNDETSFTYTLGANWKPTERFNLGLRGLGEYQPSEDMYGCSSQTRSIGLTASYRFFERLRVTGSAFYRREEYERRLSTAADPYGHLYSVDDITGDNRDDDAIQLTGRVTYSLNNFASIYAYISYFDLTSSIDDFEYDRTRYGFGAMLRY